MTGDISTGPHGVGDRPEDQERLRALAGDFAKLEEAGKDRIRELTRKLADIHCGGESGGAAFGKAAPPFQIQTARS